MILDRAYPTGFPRGGFNQVLIDRAYGRHVNNAYTLIDLLSDSQSLAYNRAGTDKSDRMAFLKGIAFPQLKFV